MDDWSLIRKYVAGEKAAMETLIRRHVGMVYATASRVVGSADADDVTQAVFLLLTQRAPGMVEKGTVAGWLHRATQLCAANVRKVEGRRRKHQMEAGMQMETQEQAGAAMEWLELLDQGLAQLRERDKAAVLLRHGEGRSFEECAVILGMTAEATRKRAERGLLKLKRFFAGKGVALPAAGLGAMIIAVPGKTVEAAVAAAHGAPLPATATALTKGVVVKVGVPKLLLGGALALVLLGAFLLPKLLTRATTNASTTPVAKPATAAANPPIAATTKNRIEMVVANPGHPTEAEVRTFLKLRLDRLSNILVDYTVKTEYAEPAGGWPREMEPIASAIGPEQVVLGEADQLPRTKLPFVSYPIFPSGTVERRKTFQALEGESRYESWLVKENRIVPFPAWAKEYGHTVEVVAPDRLDRVYYIGDAPALAGRDSNDQQRNSRAGLLEPDVELALGLSVYPSGFRDIGHGQTYKDRLTRGLSFRDVDELNLYFPDEDHVVVTRPIYLRIMSSPIPSIAAAATQPPSAGRVLTEAQARDQQWEQHDEWVLDRKNGYALTTFRHFFGHAKQKMEIEMSDFEDAGGLLLPRKAVSNYDALPTTDEPPYPVWRTDTLSIQRVLIEDSSNDRGAYAMPWPANVQDQLFGNGRNPLYVGVADPDVMYLTQFIQSDPLVIGADPLSTTWLAAHGDPRELASPLMQGWDISKPKEWLSPWWQGKHKSFTERMTKGGVDVLFLGDGLIENWSLEKDLWAKEFEPLHAANFGLRADGVENILWRVTHGELAGASPKLIVLQAGSVNAGSIDWPPLSQPPPRPTRHIPYSGSYDWPLQREFSSFQRVGERRKEDTPDAIAAAIETLVREVQTRSPGAKILLLGIPPQGANPSTEPVTTIRARIAAVNERLAKLDDGTNIRFLDLAKQTAQPDGTLAPEDFLDSYIPKTKVYTRWTETVLPVIKEMLAGK